MKKPLNKFALLLWVLALVLAMGEAWTFYGAWQMASALPSTDRIYVFSGGLWRNAGAVLMQSAVLGSLGLLIEMVDQVRCTVARAIEPQIVT
jgi:hypothetical protein